CTSFAQIATTSGTVTSYSNTGLAAATSYSYRVRAADAAGNLSGYSNTATATTGTSATLAFVQVNSTVPQSPTAAAAVAYTAARRSRARRTICSSPEIWCW